ncbi:MAG: SsrA-binding protein SmpB [Planctomycetota bacterium]
MAKKNRQNKPQSVRLSNKRAWHDYHIIEKVECGIALTGTEVKSLRAGQAKIDEAYARVEDGEVYLVGEHISPYRQAGEAMQHDPTRKRKLLLRRRQIRQLEQHVRQKGKTIVPLSVYFHRGWAKCEIGVAEGKRTYDKRQALKERQQKREIARELRRYKR